MNCPQSNCLYQQVLCLQCEKKQWPAQVCEAQVMIAAFLNGGAMLPSCVKSIVRLCLCLSGSPSLCPSFALLCFYPWGVGIKTKNNSSAPKARRLLENLSLMLTAQHRKLLLNTSIHTQMKFNPNEVHYKIKTAHFSLCLTAKPFLKNNLPLPRQELWGKWHHETSSTLPSLSKGIPGDPPVIFFVNSKFAFLFIACSQSTCSEEPGVFVSSFLLLPIWAVDSFSCFSTGSANNTDANVAAIHLLPLQCMSIISKS